MLNVFKARLQWVVKWSLFQLRLFYNLLWYYLSSNKNNCIEIFPTQFSVNECTLCYHVIKHFLSEPLLLSVCVTIPIIYFTKIG